MIKYCGTERFTGFAAKRTIGCITFEIIADSGYSQQILLPRGAANEYPEKHSISPTAIHQSTDSAGIQLLAGNTVQ